MILYSDFSKNPGCHFDQREKSPGNIPSAQGISPYSRNDNIFKFLTNILRGGAINSFFQEIKIMNDLPAGKGRDASHKYFSIAIAIQQYFGEADCLLSLFPWVARVSHKLLHILSHYPDSTSKI